MGNSEQPRGWGWNPSVITLCIAVGTILFFGGTFIGDQGRQIKNIEKESELRIEAIQQQVNEAKRDAKIAKDMVISDNAGDQTPDASPTPKVRKNGKEKETTR